MTASAIAEAVAFRRHWMDSDTLWDICPLTEAVGDFDLLLRALPEHLHPLLALSGGGEDCSELVVAPGESMDRRKVYLERVEILGSTAIVRVYVRHGDYSHRETFHMVRRSGTSDRWRVADVMVRPGLVI